MNDKENMSMSELTSKLGDIEVSSAGAKPTPTPQRKPLTSFNNFETPVKPSELLGNNSPKRGTSTRVIESLHNEIDGLKSEIAKLRSNNDELKKSNDVVKKRRDQLVEQLSNTKHENETMNSLLQRKQRRINDLEEQLSEVSNSSDDYKFKLQTLQTRYDKLHENEAASTSEYERLKIAYDTIVASQKEYRNYYTKEVKELREKLDKFTQEKQTEITKNIGLINKSDATIYRSIKSVTLRSREIEERATKRDQVLLTAFASLTHQLDQHSFDVAGIMKYCKELFHEIAYKVEIDKEALLEDYLAQNPERMNPFVEIEEDEEPEPIAPENQSSPVEPTHERGTNGDLAPLPLNLKKKNEKKLTLSKIVEKTMSIEERVTSLGKELNSMIPLKDRTASIESVGGRGLKRNQSRRSSRIMDSNQVPRADSRRSSRIYDSNQPDDSRRSSRILDASIIDENGSAKPPPSPSDLASRIGYKHSHSRVSSISTDISQVNGVNGDVSVDENGAAKTKRKRQRRRRTNKRSNFADTSFDGGDFSGNEIH